MENKHKSPMWFKYCLTNIWLFLLHTDSFHHQRKIHKIEIYKKCQQIDAFSFTHKNASVPFCPSEVKNSFLQILGPLDNSCFFVSPQAPRPFPV